jgi:aspartate/methionine/tyrosine aminotransferase
MDSGMFLPIQLAAAAALQLPEKWYQLLNETYKLRQVKTMQLLKVLGCEYNHSQQGMFVWAKVPKQYQNGFELSDYILYNHNVFLTPGGIFGSNGNNYIRLSLCQPTDVIDEALARIQKNYDSK